MADLGGWHRRLIETGPRSRAERLLLVLLRLAAVLYALLVRLRAAFYRYGWRRAYRAPVPVISVGNLTVGGTGKTPVTDYLVKLLLARGLRVAVVSRGYGGGGVVGDGLVSAGAGPLVEAQAAGDEPYLLARRNPSALVLVNPRRRAAVAAAVRDYAAQVVVLDDGFQHLAVARDLDIVLLDACRPLGNGRVLPAGRLREPAAALRRADLLVLTRSAGEAPPLLPVDRPLLRCAHRLAATAVSLSGAGRPLAELAGRRVAAFAGIADPGGFFEALRAAGLTLTATLALPDHVRYESSLRERLAAAARGAECLVTTEKDAVKLAGADFAVPCYQVPMEIVFQTPERLAAILDHCLQGQGGCMTLDPQLLEILACPKCKGPVTPNPDESGLVCDACRLVYPVRDNIPVMLIDEAERF